MRYNNNFVIHTTEQLIDINKGLRNFDANISITSQNEDDTFDIVIVTQKQLDSTDFTLNYKKINHYININVKSNKQANDDYVLVIKSTNKVNIEIVIDITDLDDNTIVEDVEDDLQEELENNLDDVGIDDDIISDVDIGDIANADELEIMKEDIEDEIKVAVESKQNDSKPRKGGYLKYLKYIFILLVVGLCIYFLFFTNSTKSTKPTKKLKIENESESIVDVKVEKSVSPPPKRSSKSGRSTKISKEGGGSGGGGNESLLEQLRKIREN